MVALGLALACLPSCDDDDDDGMGPETSAAQFTITPRAAAADADGATRTWVVVKIPTETDAAKRKVAISTDLGQFAKGAKEATLDIGRGAIDSVALVSPVDTGTAHLTASTAGEHRHATVVFGLAKPTGMSLDAGAFTLAASDAATTTVRARLTRATGVPTRGWVVHYRATKPDGSELGKFRLASRSDSTGASTAQYWVGATDYRGEVTISAFVLENFGAADTLASATAELHIVAPK